jgi:hemoglobin-like flavoprotein
MTPEQIELVQSSWKQVIPIRDTAAELFYGRLFELNPKLQSFFSGDMKDQGRKLTTMISTAVNGLTKLDEIVPAVEDLGRRHIGYGVAAEDYDTVGAALLWTLEQGLADTFTPAHKEAWTETYGLLATTMKGAAASSNQ